MVCKSNIVVVHGLMDVNEMTTQITDEILEQNIESRRAEFYGTPWGFDRKLGPSEYDRVGANTLLMENGRGVLRAHLEG